MNTINRKTTLPPPQPSDENLNHSKFDNVNNHYDKLILLSKKDLIRLVEHSHKHNNYPAEEVVSSWLGDVSDIMDLSIT